MQKPKVYIDQDMVDGEVLPFVSGSVAIYSARCPQANRPNEDTAAVVQLDEERGVLIVADGMGGGRAGDRASQIAVAALVESISGVASSGMTLRSAILDGFEKANQKVLELGIGAGTTLAVLEIQKNTVRPYHVGDSVILAIGQRGKVKLQTVAHSPVGYAIEAGYLEEQEALHHEERHIVLNMIGSADMHIALGPELELACNDTVILSSDGLFDNLRTEEIIERSRKGALGDVMQTLARDCRERMLAEESGAPSKPDDVTVLTFRPLQSGKE